MKDRIQQFLRSENKSSSKFAEEIGVQPSGVSHVLSGRNKPSLDFILKMLNTYNSLNTDWLLFGKGEMYRSEGTPLLLNDKDSGSSRQNDENFREGNLFKGFDREFESDNPETGANKIRAGVSSIPGSERGADDLRKRPGSENFTERYVSGDSDTDKDTEKDTDRGTERAISDRIIIFYADGTYREYNPRR